MEPVLNVKFPNPVNFTFSLWSKLYFRAFIF